MALRILSWAAVVGLMFGGLAIYSKTIEPAASSQSTAPHSLSGTYLDSLGGKLYVEVDEAGRLEGFYEHGATFGEVYGRVEGNTLTGFWMENGSPMTCANERHGAATWGRLKWAFNDESGFVGLFNYCGAEPIETKAWSGTRVAGR
jgi:hypothetical protein